MPQTASINQPYDSSYRWVIVALAATAFTMTFISRFAWPPLISVVAPEMKIQYAKAMAYMTAFYIGYVATQLPGGVLADRFGPRIILTFALLLQGLGTIGLGLTNVYSIGFICRIICGFGGGCVYSACLKSVVSWFSPQKRGLAFGIVMAGPSIGVALPNMLLPYLEKLGGWQWAFRSVGFMLLAIGVILFIFMRDIHIGSGPRKSIIVGLKYVVGKRNILLVALTGFAGVWVQIGFGSIGNAYITSKFNVDTGTAGWVMFFYGIVGIFIPALAGFLLDTFQHKKKHMAAGVHAALAVLCLLFGWAGSLTAIFALAIAIGLSVAFLNTSYAVILADNTNPEWMATAGGLSNTIFQIGALLSPLALGLARDLSGDFVWGWWILAAGSLLGTVFISSLAPADKS